MSLPLTQAGLSSPDPTVKFDTSSVTFTPSMAKRPGQRVFDAGPLAQGITDFSLPGDIVTVSRGDVLGNPVAQAFYQRMIKPPWTIMFWWTPEYSSADLTTGSSYFSAWRSSNFLCYRWDFNRFEMINSQAYYNFTVTAGTTYLVVVRASDVALDGTNYACISVNDVHSFGRIVPFGGLADVSWESGSLFNHNVGLSPALGVVENYAVYRRTLYDGAYGTPPIDGTDELAAIYAGGSGLDPAQVTGSWDVVLSIPTNSSTGALTTGTGEAWSHPHGSSVPDVSFMSDGDSPGTPYAVEFNGTSTYIDCGSGATLDDICAAGGQITVGAWFRVDRTTGEATIAIKGQVGSAGWLLYVDSSGNLHGYVKLATVNADNAYAEDVRDGKWHYGGFHYNDTTKQLRIFLDGRWSSAHTGTGAYASEAAYGCRLGRRTAVGWYLKGGMAWAAIWSDDHHVAGTDFVPPRTAPAPGGNLVECWHLDEGTGAAAAAQVTSPANDGTITSGSWSAVWEFEGTGTYPQSLLTDASATLINYGSGANIDDLPTGAMTIEGWFAAEEPSQGNGLLAKQNGSSNGWFLGVTTSNRVYAYIFGNGGSTFALYTASAPLRGWHHYAMTFDSGGDSKIYLFIDGVLRAVSGALGVAYLSDAAASLYAGSATQAGWGKLDGWIGWHRVSNSVRYTGTTIGQAYFIPSARDTCPANDANAHLLIPMTDGAGTTTTDGSGNGYNGTITMGTGSWLNTCDMETEAPHERVYPWGYSFASAAADDGITIIEAAAVTAETDYVIRASLSVGMSGRAQPYIEVYDNIGAAQIGADFIGPKYTGTHDGAGNAATLADSTARWVYNFTGWKLYNITDGSSTTVTSNTQTTQVGTLSGGTDNDWDAGDVYLLRPPSSWRYVQYPWQETYVIRTPAGCTSLDVKVLNAAGEGITHVHQVEVYKSLLANGDHEDLDGGSPGAAELITGWTNNGLDAGDTEPEAAIIHAGAQSLEWNAAAGSGEGQYYNGAVATVDKYYCFGGWYYGDGTGDIQYGTQSFARARWHNAVSDMALHSADGTPKWKHDVGVMRCLNATIRFYLEAGGGAGDRFTDDVYMVELDDVSLTVTPASQANSLEGTGIRVDGQDICTHPVGKLGTKGCLVFRVIVRQDISVVGSLHDSFAYLMQIRYDGSNYILLRLNTSNQLQCGYNAQGAGAVTANYNVAGAWAPGDNILVKLKYGSSGVRVWLDGSLVINSAPACVLAAAPTSWFVATSSASTYQGDIVIANPY
jgi:hypothetical protein